VQQGNEGLEQFGYAQELRRALSTRDLIIYGLIFMVPIAPQAVYGFVWDASKGMVPSPICSVWWECFSLP